MDHVPVRMTAGLLDPLPISEGSPSELDRTVILSNASAAAGSYVSEPFGLERLIENATCAGSSRF